MKQNDRVNLFPYLIESAFILISRDSSGGVFHTEAAKTGHSMKIRLERNHTGQNLIREKNNIKKGNKDAANIL